MTGTQAFEHLPPHLPTAALTGPRPLDPLPEHCVYSGHHRLLLERSR